METTWIEICAVGAIDLEDVRRFDHAGQTFAIYRTAEGGYCATEGLCTHGKVHLAGGFVLGSTIECPKHNGRFDITTGKAKGAPACVDLRTYPVKVERGIVMLGFSAELS